MTKASSPATRERIQVRVAGGRVRVKVSVAFRDPLILTFSPMGGEGTLTWLRLKAQGVSTIPGGDTKELLTFDF